MAFTFTYQLVGRGSCVAMLADEEAAVIVTASYLSNALGDLVQAVNALLHGATTAVCHWQEEPGEYRWLFKRNGKHVEIHILWFADTFSHQRDERGLMIFVTRCPLRRLALQVKNQLDTVLECHSTEGYKQLWVSYEFPTFAYTKLVHWFEGRT